MPDNTIHQIEQFHSEWSRMELGAKMGFIVSRQAELNAWANNLAKNRLLRGYFTPEEEVAIHKLQDIQNDLDQHKAEVNREVYNEFRKALLKLVFTSGPF